MSEGRTSLRLHSTAKFQVLGLKDDKVTPASTCSLTKAITAPILQLSSSSASALSSSVAKRISVFLDVNEEYTRTRIHQALLHPSRAAHFQVTLGPGHGDNAVPLPPDCGFQWSEYERIDWEAVLCGKHGAASYCVRKGLSRKAQLAHYTRLYVCKHPDSILKNCMPQTVVIDTWSVWQDDCGQGEAGLADIVVSSASSC